MGIHTRIHRSTCVGIRTYTSQHMHGRTRIDIAAHAWAYTHISTLKMEEIMNTHVSTLKMEEIILLHRASHPLAALER